METERLELRLLSEGDLEAWTDFLGDPEATRLLHTPEPVLDPERVLTGLRRWVAMTEGPIGMYALVDRESGETVGFVGFVRRELDWGDEIELGWLIRRAHWGRGYATEAARALRPLVPGRIVSMIRVENEASANVARKLGMSIERELDYYGFRTHVWVAQPPSGSRGRRLADRGDDLLAGRARPVSVLALPQRQLHPERSAPSGVVLDPGPTVMHRGELSDKGQPDAGAG